MANGRSVRTPHTVHILLIPPIAHTPLTVLTGRIALALAVMVHTTLTVLILHTAPILLTVHTALVMVHTTLTVPILLIAHTLTTLLMLLTGRIARVDGAKYR